MNQRSVNRWTTGVSLLPNAFDDLLFVTNVRSLELGNRLEIINIIGGEKENKQ